MNCRTLHAVSSLFIILSFSFTFSEEAAFRRNHTKVDKGKFFQLKDLSTVLNWAATASKRDENRIFSDGLVSQLVSAFENWMSMISNVMTIWGFMESRESINNQPDTNEVIEEWNTQIENLGSRMDEVKDSIKKLTCRIDMIYSNRNRNVSRECLQLMQKQPNSTKNNIEEPMKMSELVNQVKYSFAPTTALWWIG